MADYPTGRAGKHWSHRLVRLMFRACAANEIGTDGLALVVLIAHTEDAKRYTAAVTFWNEQLISILGLGSWGRLNRARERCVAAGWLHYEARKRSVGRYWTTIPVGLNDLGDCDVSCDADTLVGGGDPDSHRLVTTGDDQAGIQCGLSGDQTGIQRRLSGDPSTLSLTPIPNPKRESARARGVLPKVGEIVEAAIGGCSEPWRTPEVRAHLERWCDYRRAVDDRAVSPEVLRLQVADLQRHQRTPAELGAIVDGAIGGEKKKLWHDADKAPPNGKPAAPPPREPVTMAEIRRRQNERRGV